MNASPLPMLHQPSTVAFMAVPTIDVPDAQVVMEMPEFWSISMSHPAIIEETIDTASSGTNDRTYRSRFLRWERSLVANAPASFVFQATPLGGAPDRWPTRLTVYVTEKGIDFRGNAVETFHARVGDDSRPGSFVQAYPDGALDREFMDSLDNPGSGSSDPVIVTYVDGTSEPILEPTVDPAIPTPEDPWWADGHVVYLQARPSPALLTPKRLERELNAMSLSGWPEVMAEDELSPIDLLIIDPDSSPSRWCLSSPPPPPPRRRWRKTWTSTPGPKTAREPCPV